MLCRLFFYTEKSNNQMKNLFISTCLVLTTFSSCKKNNGSNLNQPVVPEILPEVFVPINNTQAFGRYTGLSIRNGRIDHLLIEISNNKSTFMARERGAIIVGQANGLGNIQDGVGLSNYLFYGSSGEKLAFNVDSNGDNPSVHGLVYQRNTIPLFTICKDYTNSKTLHYVGKVERYQSHLNQAVASYPMILTIDKNLNATGGFILHGNVQGNIFRESPVRYIMTLYSGGMSLAPLYLNVNGDNITEGAGTPPGWKISLNLIKL